MVLTGLSTVVVSVIRYGLKFSLGALAATPGNIEPGIGVVGSLENYTHFPDFGKWYLSYLMLLVRLELFTVLILFSPAFWKK
ncbi:MAG: hypothetical protein R6U04_13860 [Bacteroidales bacterium]